MKKFFFMFSVVLNLFACEEITNEDIIKHVNKDVEQLLEQNNLKGEKYKIEIDSSHLQIPKDFYKNANDKDYVIIPFWIGKKEDSLYLDYFCSRVDLEENFLNVHLSPKLYKIIDSLQKTRSIPRYRGWKGMIIKKIKP